MHAPLTTLRSRLGLSVHDVAETTGISSEALEAYELTSDVPISHAAPLARALGLTLDELGRVCAMQSNNMTSLDIQADAP